MIYVMRSASFKKGTTNEFETIIKIGYTGDSSKKSRFDIYLTENPTIQTLYLIPEGTERDERNLHRYFNKYKLYGHEWFKDVQEIIDFFETHKTKESLKEVESWKLSSHEKNISVKNRRSNKDKTTLISLAIGIILKNNKLNNRETRKSLERYLWYKIDNFWDTIKNEFSEYEEDIRKEIEGINNMSINVDSPLEYTEVYNYLVSEFSKDKEFVRRMKLLCDVYFQYPDFYTKYANSSLQCIIPIEYQNYINLLGFERIRALKYQEGEILNFIKTQNKLETFPISTLFTVGSRYSKSQIKETLRDFYTSNNISKNPKATDLEDYFEIKPCKVKNDEGKWENGFEILKKKII